MNYFTVTNEEFEGIIGFTDQEDLYRRNKITAQCFPVSTSHAREMYQGTSEWKGHVRGG